MSEPFMGQVEIFGFNFPPRNWAQCNGQILGISQNQALFSLLGTMYGGNGQTTFALPDLRGRVPVGMGTDHTSGGWTQGEAEGSETHTLTSFEIPAHTHTLMAAAGTVTSSNTDVPSDKVGLGVTTGLTSSGGAITVNLYLSDPNPTAILNGGVVSPITTGNGGKPHENRMPSLALNVCICLMGLYPQRN